MFLGACYSTLMHNCRADIEWQAFGMRVTQSVSPWLQCNRVKHFLFRTRIPFHHTPTVQMRYEVTEICSSSFCKITVQVDHVLGRELKALEKFLVKGGCKVLRVFNLEKDGCWMVPAPCQVTHNHLWLWLQGIWHLLLASMGRHPPNTHINKNKS